MDKETVKQKIADRFGARVRIAERSAKRVYVYAENEVWVALAAFLFNDLGARFDTGAGVDDRDGVEVMFFFPFDREGYFVTIKTFARKPRPELDSISPLIPGAKWIERDIYEMFEVNFRNHPDLRPLLRSDTRPADFYPHRREVKRGHEMSRSKLDGQERADEVAGRPPKGKNP